jgi:biotin synthase
MAHANSIREHFRGLRIDLCAIVNAKSGRCSENCIFCAQSAHYKTTVKTYPLLAHHEIITHAQAAKKHRARHFSIVISGRGINQEQELSKICRYIADISATAGIIPCASLGILTREQFFQLRAAGLKRYHHNLETAESHFGSICSTHSFQQRIATIRMAQEAGFEVCSGGILGMGETPQQRIELAFTLRDLAVDSVALNFLNPIPGTRFADNQPIDAWDLLKMIAIYRFILPKKEIRICGGRQRSLGGLQSRIFSAGADAIITGNYLTTKGTPARDDIAMIYGLGLGIKRE